MHEVWFYPGIPATVGIDGMIGVPGLIIEGENLVSKLKYSLQSYVLNQPIQDGQLWPSEFNEPFKKLSPFVKITKP